MVENLIVFAKTFLDQHEGMQTLILNLVEAVSPDFFYRGFSGKQDFNRPRTTEPYISKKSCGVVGNTWVDYKSAAHWSRTHFSTSMRAIFGGISIHNSLIEKTFLDQHGTHQPIWEINRCNKNKIIFISSTT